MRLPKIEVLMIFVFFGCVAVWAVSKCTDQRGRVAPRNSDRETEDRPARRDTVFVKPQNPAPPATTTTPTLQQTPPPPTVSAPVNLKSPEKTSRPELGKPGQTATSTGTSNAGASLFCNVEGLKVRKDPNVHSNVVATLKKHETVTFLNQKTEFTEELNLGDGKVTDHWVKIRTKGGQTGWVFGAGVHYYKK
jgi:hypothetical protein